MENLSHSRLPSKAAHASVAKRGCNGGNFAGKTVYEDVFGGPPKFGVPTLSPRPEDYREIFGGFHASRVTSIPVLDLPLVDEEEVFFDVRGCGFDYREVFGGVDGLDFATSFEELLKESNGGGDRHDCDGDVEGDSSEEAWTPVETESLSGESDRSGQNQQSSNGDSYEPIDSSLEFSISYHKVNHQSNDSFSNGVTRIAEPRLPEYTCVVDNSRPVRKTENKNLPVYVCDDRSLDFTGQTMQERHLPKTMSNPAKRTADPRPFTDRLESNGSYGKVSSPYDEMFVTISEISLKTHPSEVPPPPRRPPPFLDGKRKDYENSQTTASGGTSGHSSPPYFDVEIDASSAAAASAAAMEEAMEKARAKMKSAKERMERKREGSQNGIKPGSKRDAKEKKEKLSKVVDGSKNVKDERVLGTSRKEDIAMKPPILQEGQEVAKTTEAVFNPLEREKAFNMAEMSADEKRGKQSVLSQGTDKINLVDEWQEATQFFDLVRTDDSKMAFVQENNYSFSIDFENIKRNEHQLNAEKASMEALQQQKENSQCREEAVREDHELDKVLRNLRTAKEACERGGNTARSEAAKGAHRRKEHEKKVKLAPAVGKLDESEVKSQIFQPLENGKKSARVEGSHKLERQVTGKQEENEVKSRIIQPSENGKKSTRAERSQKVEKQVIGKQEENEVKSRIIQPLQKGKKSARAEGSQNLEKRVIGMQEENEVQPSFTQPLENGEKSARVEGSQNFEQVNAEEFQIQSEVQLGVNDFKYEHKEREASISMENQERSKECQETKDEESRQREVSEQGEIDDIKVRLFGEQVDDVKSTEGACGEEDRADNTLMQTCELDGDEKKEEVDELDEGEMIWRMALEQLEKETRRKQALEQEEIQQKERKTCAEEANEIISEKVLEQENNEKTQKEVYEDDKRASKDDWDENDEMKRDLSKEQKESEELKEVNEVLWQIEDDSEGEVSNGAGAHQHMECEDQLASNGVYGLDSHVKHEFARTDESCDDQEEPETILIKDCSKVTDEDSDCESLDAREEENLIWKFGFSRMDQDQLQFAASNLRMEEVTCLDHRENGVKKTDEAGISIGQRNAEKISSVLRTGSANEKLGKGERVENVKEVEAALKQEEEKKRFFPPPAVKESAETGRKIDAAKSTLPEARGDTLRTAQPTKTNQSTEKKDNDVSLTAKEKEFERLKRERELEIERLRKMEEESEREREREKDRMAVDRVTLEARETAYADPRERVERAALERATAEARQRSTGEARERLEKATVEARLRAERAAVERATAEARERAFEKAKAERAAFEARQRIERSVSDKFSTYSRNSATGSSSFDQQNQQYKTTSSFNDSRNTSDYNGVEGESAQRCKARLERYRRTAERAANALAEKNMRDLLAQREQAERHRLAETLDADVRRWSNGKEGNLRALLSTLQYILGSESGWQPVPLTEVITSAAVKKAYRKATLCVHPDKLQQRGASIQQKYICEKVFDLLKEAWNKFNSEER